MTWLLKLKKKLLLTLYPYSKVTSILRGPLKGYKYCVSELGWAPIFGRWEPGLQNIFSNIVKKESVVYDLGANIGIHTMLFSKLVGENGKVYAFEPLEDNIEEMNKNLKANNITNVNIAKYAVTKNAGELSFKIGKHPSQGSLQGIGCESGEIVTVPTISLAHFIEQGNDKPDFLKVDVEGEEYNALASFEGHFAAILPTIIVELHTQEQCQKVCEFLSRYGYEIYRIGNDTTSLKHLVQVKMFRASKLEKSSMWGTVVAFHPSKSIF